MAPKYLLQNEPLGMSAAEVQRRTGLRAWDTPLGVMMEAPPDPVADAIRFGLQMEAVNRALNPPPCNCRGVIHNFNCPLATAVT